MWYPFLGQKNRNNKFDFTYEVLERVKVIFSARVLQYTQWPYNTVVKNVGYETPHVRGAGQNYYETSFFMRQISKTS